MQHQISSFLSALRDFGPSETLLSDPRRLELEQAEARDALTAVEAEPITSVTLPSIDSIPPPAQNEFGKLAAGSFEFARYMRQLIPRIVACPVRLCDGGHVGLRATLDLTLTGFVPASWRMPMVESHLATCLPIDPLTEVVIRTTHVLRRWLRQKFQLIAFRRVK